jgi:hypothetical protein
MTLSPEREAEIREMRPEDVPHELVMAAMKAAGLLHHDTARPALAAVLPAHRHQVIEEIAARLEAFDRAEAAAIVRAMAVVPAGGEVQ